MASVGGEWSRLLGVEGVIVEEWIFDDVESFPAPDIRPTTARENRPIRRARRRRAPLLKICPKYGIATARRTCDPAPHERSA